MGLGPQGGADVQRYAGGAAAADVAVPSLRAVGYRGALAEMRRNAAPDAFRCGVEVRKTSPIPAGIPGCQAMPGLYGGSANASRAQLHAAEDLNAVAGPDPPRVHGPALPGHCRT